MYSVYAPFGKQTHHTLNVSSNWMKEIVNIDKGRRTHSIYFFT